MLKVALSHSKAAYNLSHEPHDVTIYNSSLQYFKQDAVVDRVEELPNVALKRVTGSCIVPAFGTEHLGYGFYAFMGTFANAAREGGGYKARLEYGIQDGKNDVVKHAISDCRFTNLSEFRIGDAKARVLLMPIRFVAQVALELENVLLKLLLEAKHIKFIPFAFLKAVPRRKQRLCRDNLFKQSLMLLHI
jgi:hypothetical protein